MSIPAIMTTKMCRAKAVAISIELIAQMVREDWSTPLGFFIKCMDGLPKDAKATAAMVNNTSNEIYIVFEHDSFPLLMLGDLVPFESITFQKIKYSPVDVLNYIFEDRKLSKN